MKLMLIGGGEVGRGKTSYETKTIDEEIVKMSMKTNPNLLFIGLADSHSDSYYDCIKKNYKSLGCNPIYLKKNNLIHNPELVKEKFKQADIIYIGGGDTLKLLERIEEYDLKPLFDKALKNDTVLAGISAGAILLSKKGFSDSYILRGEKETYEFINGFGYIDISIVPHYYVEEEKTKQLIDYLKEKKETVYGLENNTALKIEDNQITVIKENNKYKAYIIQYQEKLMEEEI